MLNTPTIEAKFCPVCGAGNLDQYQDKCKCPSCGEEFQVVDPEELEALEALALEEKLEDDDRKRLEWLEEKREEIGFLLRLLKDNGDLFPDGDDEPILSEHGIMALADFIDSLESLP